jgi:transcriptional regulator with XRE-family HTH domain
VGQRPRDRPKYLASKLLLIRQTLGLSQSQLAAELNVKISGARISEYENGAREPNLKTLLAYARLAGIHIDDLVDDTITLH